WRCRKESLVAFSCKDLRTDGRRRPGPSCTARRASQTAAILIDEVRPEVPYRQWTLAFPFELHRRLARNGTLESDALTILAEELTVHLRMASEQPEGEPGFVTFIQPKTDQYSGIDPEFACAFPRPRHGWRVR